MNSTMIRPYPALKSAADEEWFLNFLRGAKNYKLISFDTETSGLIPEGYRPGMKLPSVLSISAWKVLIYSKDKIEILDTYNRYYYSKETPHPKAIQVNGLTLEKLTELRRGTTYPDFFLDDQDDFVSFCSGVDLFIGHNAIQFDCILVPCIDWTKVKVFDTKETNTGVVPTEFRYDKNDYRWPKLAETIPFYNIPSDKEQLHGSLYDSKMTLEVFKQMLLKSTVRLRRFDES